MIQRILIVIVAISFAGCATEADPDRLSWEDFSNQATAMFQAKDTPSMSQIQAEMQGEPGNQDGTSRNFLKK